MKRFFFDVSFKTHVLYDYQGRDFAAAEQARELAELIALDLECSDDQRLPGLRSPGPQHRRHLPVLDPDPPVGAHRRLTLTSIGPGGLPLQSR